MKKLVFAVMFCDEPKWEKIDDSNISDIMNGNKLLAANIHEQLQEKS